MSVRPSVHKSCFDLDEIWYVGRGRWDIYVGKKNLGSKVKVKVTWPLKLRKWRFSKSISSAIFDPIWKVITVLETRGQYLNSLRPDFWISLSFSRFRFLKLHFLKVKFEKNQSPRSPMCDISMDRGRWDKPNDTIFKVTESQGQGHVTFEVAKMTIFKTYLLRHFETDLETDYCFGY